MYPIRVNHLRKCRPPRYNWNIVESDIEHHKPNRKGHPLVARDESNTHLWVTWRVSYKSQDLLALRGRLGSPLFWWGPCFSTFYFFKCCVLCFVCLRLESCVLNAASFSGLSILDWPSISYNVYLVLKDRSWKKNIHFYIISPSTPINKWPVPKDGRYISTCQECHSHCTQKTTWISSQWATVC